MNKNKPEIVYPCEWNIRIIGEADKLILSEIDDIIKDRQYEVTPTNKSKTGKYVSFNLRLTLLSEEERANLYAELQKNKNIKFVI